MLKNSIKSLEGQSVVAILLAGGGALYLFITGDQLPEIPVEEILAHANSVSDIKEAYANDDAIQGATGFAKISATLFFMYKIFNNFIDKRTELKKKELEIDASPKTIVVPANPAATK